MLRVRSPSLTPISAGLSSYRDPRRTRGPQEPVMTRAPRLPDDRWARLLVSGLVILVLNTAYIVAWPSSSLWYFAQVLLHPLLGGVVVAVAVAVTARRGPRFVAVGAVLSLLTGLAVIGFGTTGNGQAVLAGHVVASVGATILLADYIWRGTALRRGHTVIRVSLIAATVALVLSPAIGSWHEAAWRAQYDVINPIHAPINMAEEVGDPDSPFFPSSATTTTGDTVPADFFLSSEMCGRCHVDIYEEWSESAHRFSSFNNQWYRKSIEYMQDVVGTTPSKWCAGCHDHALFFSGQFDKPVAEYLDTPAAHAGLGCVSCHAVTHVGSTMGQGDFVIEYPPLYELATSPDPLVAWMHDQLAYLAPEPHRRTFLKPFHEEQSEEFCSACHKVHLDIPVNGYRWIRGFNEYDNWQSSGVSGQGARSFYYPPEPRTCNDCHMPRVRSDDPSATDGYVRSHRFPGANTALPFVNGDPDQLRAVQDFLSAGQLSVDVFGLTRVEEAAPAPEVVNRAPTLSSTFAVGEESPLFGAGAASISTTAGPFSDVIAPLDGAVVAVRRGESVRVEVVVRTRNVGHFFPGGTVDAFDVWVEFEAVDENGQVLLHSGAVGAVEGGLGPVDPAAHFYRSLQLDAHGNPVNKRNSWMTRSVAYVRLIPPGAADTVHYRLRIPDDAGDRITLRAKVNYRKFSWWYTQWAYAGIRAGDGQDADVTASYDDGLWTFDGDTSHVSGPLKAIPNPPITVMAENEATLRVVDADGPAPVTPLPSEPTPRLRERWNDYGIGLLLQGDLRGAAAAFRRVIAIDPAYADGPINLARVLVREGDVERAIPLLETALELAPGLARAHFFLGTSLRTLGQYEEARTHLEAVRTQYPRDRVVLGEVGRVHFLERRFDDAITTFTEVLRIDPEDLNAHYNLMLAYRGIGATEEAERERVLYERFKADESADSVAGETILRSRDVNNERQPVHEHQ